ncbi:MAG: hypothetical protein ACYTGZ_03575 [Planctomycetota bacterium]
MATFLGLVTVAAVVAAGCGSGSSGDVTAARSLAAPAEPQEFQSPKPVADGAFGQAATFAGDLAAFGAPGENNSQGVVYLFEVATGDSAGAIFHPTPSTAGSFGAALAGNALVTIVGSPSDIVGSNGVSAGRAFVYRIAANELLLTFDSSNPQGGGGFGAAVAASEANFIVGAPGEDGGDSSAGRAYYFDCVTDDVLSVFESPNPQAGGHFGAAVATIDFDVFIGAPDEEKGEGRVYHFNGLSGQLLNTFTSPSPQGNGNFGGSISVAGNVLLVGAPGETAPQTESPNTGRAHAFDLSTGLVTQTFDTLNTSGGGLFGARVVLFGKQALVAGPNEFDFRQGTESGVVYIFNADGSIAAVISSPNPTRTGAFGSALAAEGEDFLVGALNETVGNDNAGRGYSNPQEIEEQ